MSERVSVACSYCGWNGTRESAILDRDRIVKCPDCFSLHSPEKARATAMKRKAAADPRAGKPTQT